MTDLSALKNTLAQQEADKPEPSEDDTIYQHYSSSRIAVKLITDKGKKVIFTNYQFITADQDIIDYLDAEIKAGMNVVTKGKAMTSEEADPMAALKRKHVAEYLEQQEALSKENAAKSRDFGATEEGSKTKIKPMSTEGVATA